VTFTILKVKHTMHQPNIRLTICLLSILCLTSCKGRPPSSEGVSEVTSSPPPAKKLTVCLLPKIKGISYFSSCHKGAQEAAQELGNIELVYDGPTDGDPKKQAEMIEQWTVDGVDVICVSPNAPDVVANAMKEARASGVHVITWDADGVTEARSFFVNQATPQAIGEGMVQAMVKDLGADTTGDVVIISSDATSANQNAWIATMKPALEKTKLRLATIKYPGENASNALADATDVIKKYPDLKGIFGISSVSFPGSAEAVQQSGKSGQIAVTGLSTPNDMKRFVHAGTVKSVVLWNTVDLGYLTIRVAEAIATGKLKPGAEKFDAGRLGEKKIVGDNVLLGDIIVFTKDNIDQHDF
jgi:rhamnose transport system substrate-binding protein